MGPANTKTNYNSWDVCLKSGLINKYVIFIYFAFVKYLVTQWIFSIGPKFIILIVIYMSSWKIKSKNRYSKPKLNLKWKPKYVEIGNQYRNWSSNPFIVKYIPPSFYLKLYTLWINIIV